MDNTNPYLPPQADLTGESTQAEAIAEDVAMATFVGKKYDYYRNKWSEAERKGSINSFNGGALLFGFLWMAYRKMYKFCGIFIAVISVETLLELALNLPTAFSSAINIGVTIGFGVFGNHLYKLHAQQKVREITAQGTPAQINAELVRQGGTHIGAAIGFLVVLITILASLAFLMGGAEL